MSEIPWNTGACDPIEFTDHDLAEMRANSDALTITALRSALRLAAVRLEILTDRMRGCHAETGKHELLDEAEMFCREARAALEVKRAVTSKTPD